MKKIIFPKKITEHDKKEFQKHLKKARKVKTIETEEEVIKRIEKEMKK